MSETFIGGAVCRRARIWSAGGRRNVRPCRMQQRTVQFSDVPWVTKSSATITTFKGLESGDGSGTFRNWRQWSASA